MHEHGLGDQVLHSLADRLAEVPPGGRLLVRLRASELSGLAAGPLQVVMDHARQHHGIPQVVVELTCEGLLGRCERCGRVVEVDEGLTCQTCGAAEVTLCAGDTVLIEEAAVCGPEEAGASG